MVPRVFLLLLVGSLFVSLSETAATGEPIRLRVATYNVENYLVQDRYHEGVWRPDYPKPEREKRAVQRTLRQIDADIVALQEMGPGPFLRELQRDLAAEGLRYPHAVLLQGAPDEVRHLAVLSRVAPVEVRHHTDPDFKYLDDPEGNERRLRIKRGLLEVVFPVPGRQGDTWSLFVLHLKSRWSEEPDDPQAEMRRTREARAARDRILERYPEGRGLYLVAGDLNASPDEAPLRRLRQRADIRITVPVPAHDSRRETWTYHYEKKGVYRQVDYFLVSPGLRPYLPAGKAYLFDALFAREGSDHRPLYLDLVFPAHP
jgi:endonuclease/exonuclease/phosphatase family metal-dependent hydrolase